MVAFGISPSATRSVQDWGILALSGVLGLVIADILVLEGLHRLGAARFALVDTFYAPMMVLLSWLFLSEQPTWWFALGAAGVVGGVSIASVDLRQALASRTPGQSSLVWGALMAFGGVCGTGISVILVKPILEVSNLVEVTWVRMLVGFLGQAIWVTLRREWSVAGVAFRPSAQWRALVPAAVVGTYISLVIWLGGFKWADASVAAVLNQMATVYILALAWWLLGERIVPRQVVGAAFAVAGAMVIVWA